MKGIFFSLLLLLLNSVLGNAQDLAVRTNTISLDFKKPNPTAVKGLPLISWKSPSVESSVSPFPSFVIEAFISSDVELKLVSMVFKNGSVVIGEKSYDVVQLKEKKVRQKLTLNDGQNVVEITAENSNGDRVTSTRTLILGEYTLAKNETDFAQNIVVKRIELENDMLNLYYDLTDSLNSHTYAMSLYSSQDNFNAKEQRVTGDIGLGIKPGANHKITWSAKEVLGADFKGKIRLELRAKMFVPFLQMDAMKNSYKRGRDISLAWKADSAPSVLNFDLYKGDKLVHSFANITNVGHTILRIPTSVKPGKDYYYKISDLNNKDQMVVTQTFGIKRKTPLLLKVLPIALIGGGAAILGGGGGSSNSSSAIPDPLAPTKIH
jgi:hypothetical protein